MIKASLTEGNLFKKLIVFALPFLLSNILQAVYGVVDLAIVSKFCSQDQITAVNVGSQFMMMIVNVLVGFSVGISVLTALFIGKNDSKRVGDVLGTMLTVFSAIALVTTVFLIILSPQILTAMNVDEDAKAPAYDYLSISLYGVVLILVYNIIAGMLRGAASTKPALLIAAIGGVLNMVFDLYFVKTLGLGARGAALASLIAQAFACIAAILLMLHGRKKYSLRLKSFIPDLNLLKKIILLGLPAAIQQFAIQLSFLILMTLVNEGGMSYTNAYGYVSKISSFAILPFVAVMSAISAIAGQSIGAGMYKRATQVVWAGILLMLPLAVIMFVIANVFALPLLTIFTSNEEVLFLAVGFIKFASLEYIIVFSIFALHGFFTSAGKTLFIMINSFISSFAVRVPLSYLLYPLMGFNGLGLAIALSPIISTVIALVYFLSNKWQPKRDAKLY